MKNRFINYIRKLTVSQLYENLEKIAIKAKK